jgi:hypothetical protein
MTKPIVIIPGFGGSLLVNAKHPTKTLFKKQVIYNRWLNIHPYSPSYMMQWKEDMHCELDISHHRIIGYKNYNPDIQPYDVYGIDGIQNLVGDFELLTKPHQDALENMFHYRYFYQINQLLLKENYVPKDNLIGFPWDFRIILDPSFRAKTFSSLLQKIEETARKHQQKVVILTHSLGGVIFKWFLEDYTNHKWCDKYIDKFVLMNAPFGGTPSAVKAVLIGDYYVPFLNRFFVDELRINSGILMGLPNTISYHNSDIFWETDKGDTIDRMNFMTDNNIGFRIWRDLYYPHLQKIKEEHPISTVIFNSSEIETPHRFFSKSLHDIPYKVSYTNGDGMIPSNSLKAAKRIFPNHEYIELKKVGHSDVISNPLFLDYMMNLLL